MSVLLCTADDYPIIFISLFIFLLLSNVLSTLFYQEKGKSSNSNEHSSIIIKIDFKNIFFSFSFELI